MHYGLLIRPDEVSKKIGDYIQARIEGCLDNDTPEIVIAVGGDGTILQAFHKYPDAIIFGVHTGHLGFFANYNPDTVDELITDINSNGYKIGIYDLLSCKIKTEEGEIEASALNEVTVLSALKTLILDVSIDEEYLETFRGTGLCISTTSGSTAYNKSLHGAVVDHELQVMQLAEIASINSNAFRTLGSPLLLGKNRRILLESDAPLELTLTVDHVYYNLKSFRSVEFYYDGKTMRMGYHQPEGFIRRIARTFIDSGK